MKSKRTICRGPRPVTKKPHRFGHPVLKIELVSIRGLRPSPNNSHVHPREQIDKLVRAIAEFGFLIPVLIDDRNRVIAGHARLEAAKALGLTEIPCIQTRHLSEAQKRAFAIFDNRLAEDSKWDFQLLAKEFEFLQSEGFALQMTGFEIPEFDMIFAADDTATKNIENDEIPDHVPTRAITKPNDVWIMRHHRLVCGDARRPECFALLMNGARAHLVFTDPPYNVKIRGHVSGKGRIEHREFAEASGEMRPAQFAKFLEDSLGLLAEHSKDGSIHFICMDWRHLDGMHTAGQRVYGELKNLVVWVKTNGGMGSLYRSQHELIFVWKNGRGKHTNNVQLGKHGRNRSNVWSYAGANSFSSDRLTDLAMHPTVKPVGLVADAILDCSRRGDLVLDSFGGSGTTLIACERTSRRARLIEIDPIYCDQTVRRWQKLTGRIAVNAAGIPFNNFEKS
jgi:DNA modification methylase